MIIPQGHDESLKRVRASLEAQIVSKDSESFDRREIETQHITLETFLHLTGVFIYGPYFIDMR